MTAVVLIAVMVDRRAVTFRTLAVAAMIVLAIAPEALVHPSFQMSFAATLGLVALVQIGMPRLFASPDHSATARVALWGGREIMTLMLASLVAGLATTPYAAFHFHRVTPYGVLANLAAMPVVSAVVMPAGLLGLLAMPFGFDGVFWWMMGLGIDWMIAVTQWVAALPGAIGRMAAFGIGPLIAASAGIILLGLLRTPLRWSGAAVLVVATVWALAVPQPDILISGRRPQCRRPRQGRPAASDADRQGCVSGEGMAGGRCRRAHAGRCLACGRRLLRRGGLRDARWPAARFVALALRSEALADDCERAALIVTAQAAAGELSQPPVIDRRTLAAAGRDGAAAKPRRICGRGRQAAGGRPAVVAGGRRRRRGRRTASRRAGRRAPWMRRHQKPTCRRRSNPA